MYFMLIMSHTFMHCVFVCVRAHVCVCVCERECVHTWVRTVRVIKIPDRAKLTWAIETCMQVHVGAIGFFMISFKVRCQCEHCHTSTIIPTGSHGGYPHMQCRME